MTAEQLIRFDSPVFYHITVQGKLNEDILEMIRADEHHVQFEGEKMITSLRVYVKDQAQLTGILNALYDMRHPILRVEYSKCT